VIFPLRSPGQRDPSGSPSKWSIKHVEWATAAILTLLAVYFHFVEAISAGGLWRDEANTVAVATLPRIGDVWKNIEHDSFPILWLLVVRSYASLVGPMNDPAFRALGFFVGLGVIGALWLNARTFRHSVPLLSLAMLALSPSMIRWGDTIRAYGSGMLMILVTVTLLWRFLEKPGVGRFAATAAAAVVSVNLLYYNSVLLLSFCSGAAAVSSYRRRWKDAALVTLIGALAALSLVIYAPTFRNVAVWRMVVRIPNYDFSWFWTKLGDTLSPAGAGALVVWVTLAATAAIYGTLAVIFPRWFNLSEHQRTVALFSVVSLLVGTIGMFLFLRALSYDTQPWYYLALLTVTALSVDTLFGAFIQTKLGRISRVAAVLILAVGGLIPGSRLLRERLTAIDIIATKLDTIAKPGDVILVNPWHDGITFSRYYRGEREWMTVPAVAWHRFHRYDQLKELMQMPDQTLPARQVTDWAGRALRSGHRVFLVGQLTGPPPGTQPRVLPPAPWPGGIWLEGAHEREWWMMVSHFLTDHVQTRTRVPIHLTQRVSDYEIAGIQMLEGWRP
jgi:hypothetical protein